MPSDKTTVATTADFAPTVVGGTDRESIVSSASRAFTTVPDIIDIILTHHRAYEYILA